MRRHRALSGLLFGILFVSLLGAAPPEGPTTMRYDPEEGLTVHYAGEVKGAFVLSAPGAPQKRNEFAVSERHTDRIASVTETERTLERTRDALSITADGRTQKAPAELLNRKETYILNELAEVVRTIAPPQGAKPQAPGGSIGLSPSDLALLPIVMVPFAAEAVSPGDHWDTGKALLAPSEGLPLEVASTTTLISLYESEGMAVALTQTQFTASGRVEIPSPPESPVKLPPGKVSFEGQVLQSVRLEDGCLLGTKARFSGGVSLSMPGGISIGVELSDVTWQSEVVE